MWGLTAGFPFLGNAFYRECGDVFSCHVVENPDSASERTLIASYAPSIKGEISHRLTGAFGELRRLTDAGLLAYPYSTREVRVCV